MKIENFCSAALALGGFFSGPLVMADSIQVGYSGSPYGQYQTGQGGEFTLTPLGVNGKLDGITLEYTDAKTKNIGLSGSFQTFCIEENEYIYPYNNVATGSLSDRALDGGVGGAITVNGVRSDPISVGTAWLYKQFALGTLAGYNYGAGRSVSAEALQQTIWWLEGEKTQISSNPFLTAVLAQFKGEVGAKADNNDRYSVKVVNLTLNGVVCQDQLVSFSVPDGGTTCALLGMVLAGFGFIRRK